MYRESISKFVQEVSLDEECIDIIQDLLESCANYVSCVCDLESVLLCGRYKLDGDEYRRQVSDLDMRRTRAHNALIANIKIINRLCSVNKLDPIFECDTNNRVEVAEEAIKIVDDFFKTRRL